MGWNLLGLGWADYVLARSLHGLGCALPVLEIV
jgi:hypothetical protein